MRIALLVRRPSRESLVKLKLMSGAGGSFVATSARSSSSSINGGSSTKSSTAAAAATSSTTQLVLSSTSTSVSASTSTTQIAPSSRISSKISTLFSASTSVLASTSTNHTPTSALTSRTVSLSTANKEPEALLQGRPVMEAAVRPIAVPDRPQSMSSESAQKSTRVSQPRPSSAFPIPQTSSSSAAPISSTTDAVVSQSTELTKTTAKNGMLLPSSTMPSPSIKLVSDTGSMIGTLMTRPMPRMFEEEVAW